MPVSLNSRPETPAAALAEVDGTPEIFAAAGDVRRQAMAVGNQAAALEGLKRTDEALTAYELSADLFQQVGEPDLRLHALKAMSALQSESGRRLQALATMKAGLDDLKKPISKTTLITAFIEYPLSYVE